MLVIPAIDLKGGRCVRLRQGRMDQETVYDDDPVAVAGRWVAAGASRLHLVDLDGAARGEPAHEATIQAIAEAYPNTLLQVGGGIRDRETAARYLDAGIEYVILGTRAVRDPELAEQLCSEFPARLFISLDARGGYVATDGWEQTSEVTAAELARRFERAGAASLVFTDIGRDGMMGGCNIEATRELARAVSVPVIASGGVSTVDEIRALAAAEEGIGGAIVGRALYDGAFTIEEALQAAEQPG